MPPVAVHVRRSRVRAPSAPWLLQRGQDAHYRGLAGTGGTQQPVHPARDGKTDVLRGLHPVGISLGYASYLQLHWASLSKDLVGPTYVKYFRPQSIGSQRSSRGLACGAPPSTPRAERSVGLAPAGVRSRRSAGPGTVAGQACIRPPVPGLVVEQALVGCVTLVRVTSRRCRSAMAGTRVNSATLCLLRQTIPKGTGSSMHGALDLAAVALALNTTSER
jgi:hypothetical protein